MPTPRARTLVVSLTVSMTLASVFALSSAQARSRPEDVGSAHVTTHASRGADELRTRMLALVNRSRHLRGLPALRINERLSREALAHSRKMSRDGSISHTPNLVAVIGDVGGTVFGEDVAKGRSLRGIRDARLRRSETRRILLDGRFHRVGLGVVHADGFFWVTLQAFD